jgi:hypothetical protein
MISYPLEKEELLMKDEEGGNTIEYWLKRLQRMVKVYAFEEAIKCASKVQSLENNQRYLMQICALRELSQHSSR